METNYNETVIKINVFLIKKRVRSEKLCVIVVHQFFNRSIYSLLTCFYICLTIKLSCYEGGFEKD